MIKINLLGEVKTRDHSAVLFLAGWAGALVLLAVVMFVVHESTGSQIADLKGETELMETQLKNLKEKTKSVADLEKRKQELDDKLKIIALLKKSKNGPVRVLDDLNLSVPERSWLTGVQESENVLRISGFAVDNQTVATFMKDLANSEYFERVDLVESKQATKDAVKLRAFTLDAKINYAGKPKATPAPAASPAAKDAVSSSSASSVAPEAPTP